MSCSVHSPFEFIFLLLSNGLLEKNKDNPVKCLTDGNPDARLSHRGVKISVEMDLVVFPGTEIKPLNHSTACPDKGIRLISGPQRWRQDSESGK